MANFRFSFLLFTAVLLSVLPASLQAQQTLGVRWTVPENEDTATSQLDRFNELGITTLEISSQLSSSTWQKIDSLDMEVYGSLGITFPTATTFSKLGSIKLKRLQDRASAYLSQPSVTAIELFRHGATHTSSFWNVATSLGRQLKQSRDVKLYYTSRDHVTANKLTDFAILDVRFSKSNISSIAVASDSTVKGFLYNPASDIRDLLNPFKQFLEATSVFPDKTVWVHSDWLLKMLQKRPQFADTITSITDEKQLIFPVPNEEIPESQNSILAVIVLLFVWGTLAVHYNGSPLYRKSLFRYFTAHTFFINDIFQRQIRSPFLALLVILQSILLISATSYAAFSALLTPLGQEAFFHHFPLLQLFGSNPFSIFAWSFLVLLILALISILWLNIVHRKSTSFTQITTIYAWPQHINFILCTVGITVFSASGNSIMVVIFTLLSILVFLMGFVFTSFDTFRVAKSKLLHLLKTSIPYLALLTKLLIWVLFNDRIREAISLSLNLK